ncbi:DJ-1 family glyoxalase III [uncultured Marinobacter sp.]|uniref:DJ-1 family glyoxalase III n=1 Tax=uncultured Marinobacter sp. TaxID=187379 RepID=UPI0030DA650D
MTQTALVPIADGSEEIEAVCIIDLLRRAGVEVTVASIHDYSTITASRQTRVTADALLKDCAHQPWDLIAVPGGMPGARNLSECGLLIERLKQQRDDGRLYAAICAAPELVLATHGLLEDRAATGHSEFRDGLPDQSRVGERVVVDQNCITSQGPGTALEFGLALIEQLCGRETRDTVASRMML